MTRRRQSYGKPPLCTICNTKHWPAEPHAKQLYGGKTTATKPKGGRPSKGGRKK